MSQIPFPFLFPVFPASDDFLTRLLETGGHSRRYLFPPKTCSDVIKLSEPNKILRENIHICHLFNVSLRCLYFACGLISKITRNSPLAVVVIIHIFTAPLFSSLVIQHHHKIPTNNICHSNISHYQSWYGCKRSCETMMFSSVFMLCCPLKRV